MDCPDIIRVMNWGVPNALEDLVQESGRDGSAACRSNALSQIVGKEVTKEVKEYGKNQAVCRRMLLLKNYLAMKVNI